MADSIFIEPRWMCSTCFSSCYSNLQALLAFYPLMEGEDVLSSQCWKKFPLSQQNLRNFACVARFVGNFFFCVCACVWVLLWGMGRVISTDTAVKLNEHNSQEYSRSAVILHCTSWKKGVIWMGKRTNKEPTVHDPSYNKQDKENPLHLLMSKAKTSNIYQ